ncbi:hypothetical protein O0L34_g2830 [Tuta absoluta]|nr:hypothetical protein O0L34_g2830 [Tuta absoluta]
MYLVPEWITRLLEDYEKEELGTCARAMKLLEEDGRKAVWNMSTVMRVDTNGVPGLACSLLERYLFRHLQDYMRMGVINIDEWESFKQSLASQIPLVMASCVQLAAKMSSVSLQVNANLVRACLLCKGVSCSVDDIIRSEFQVFSTIGFRVPLWTSMDAAQMLAVEVGLPATALEGVALLVNIAEYRRDRVTASVRDIATSSPSLSFNAGCLGTPHLAAGAVAASARYLACAAPDPTPRLAQLTRAPLCYIKCVCDVILADVLADDTDVPQRSVCSRKRKRSH